MTQEEILEYNKLCAEFLGVDIHYSVEVYKDSKSPLRQYIDNRPKSEPLLFHSDWNWIMEVVEAIEKLPGIKQFHIVDNSAYLNGGLNVGSFANESGKKEAVVQAINQFLIWYNENNKRTSRIS